MLDLTNSRRFEATGTDRTNDDIEFIVTASKRHWRLIAATTSVLLLLGLVYLATAVPKYTATADILINTQKNRLLENEQVLGDVTIDAGQVESQVEVVRSDSIAAAVVKDLHLEDDPEFTASRGGFWRLILRWPMSNVPLSEDEKVQTAIARVASGITAKRVGLTYLIEIGFTSTSPIMAAKVANAIADAYMVGELDAKYQASKRTSRWLRDRIDELRDQANAADQKVQQFKKDNNIVETGRGLMSDQQLSAVSVQLIQAKAAVAEAKARLDRITQIRSDSASVPDATIADALHNDVITRLRAQYLDIAGREATWSEKYGPQHAAAVNLRSQMAELKNSINDEIQRIAETYKSDYEIATKRQESLQQSLDELISASQSTAKASVELRDLDSAAQTYRNLYDSFLQKFEVATQQQSFPVTDARVINPASPPTSKSSPKTTLVLGGSLILGLALGAGLALLRERMNKSLRTVHEVETATNGTCLGILPAIDPVSTVDTPGQLGRGRVRQVVTAPFSRFSETMRNVKVSIDLARQTSDVKVVGIVSSLPREGKTTVASNLAQILAPAGQTLLIDCDLRNPSLTAALAPDAQAGLVEVLLGRMSLADVIRTDAKTGLDFVPAVVHERVAHTAELVSSAAMLALLTEAKRRYESIVLDFPPLIPIADAKAASHMCDGFIFVIEWGRTNREAIREALSSSNSVNGQLIGSILNRASGSELRQIDSYKGRYYSQYYSEQVL